MNKTLLVSSLVLLACLAWCVQVVECDKPLTKAEIIARAQAAARKAAGIRKAAAAAKPPTIVHNDTSNPADKVMQCSNDRCRLPFCQCIIAEPPFGLPRSSTPQMVLLAFHDSVSPESLKVYRKIFPLTRRNPHGCPQAATIFVDVHNDTDYCLVAKLWERGMEVAVTGSTSAAQARGQQFWQTASVEELAETMTEWREALHKKSQVPLSDIRGWRTPFSQVKTKQK